MLTPYACPKGLVPMPNMDTLAESGFPGTRGCFGMFAVMLVVTECADSGFKCALSR